MYVIIPYKKKYLYVILPYPIKWVILDKICHEYFTNFFKDKVEKKCKTFYIDFCHYF